MLNDKDIQIALKHFKGKRLVDIIQTDNGNDFIFEGELVIRVYNEGYDNYDTELTRRVPTYTYERLQ
jgi:hypothetical protein